MNKNKKLSDINIEIEVIGNIYENEIVSNQVEEIKTGAFSRYSEYAGAPTFTSIILPDTLKIIGEGAFLGCEGLGEIVIPEAVDVIENYTFAYCLHLTKVVLSENVKSIGLYAFAGCAELISINLENVEEIADYGFTSATALSIIDLSEVQTVGYGAFASTSIAGELIAPQLRKVGDYAFQNTNLTRVEALKLASIGEAAFEGNKALTEFEKYRIKQDKLYKPMIDTII